MEVVGNGYIVIELIIGAEVVPPLFVLRCPLAVESESIDIDRDPERDISLWVIHGKLDETDDFFDFIVAGLVNTDQRSCGHIGTPENRGEERCQIVLGALWVFGNFVGGANDKSRPRCAGDNIDIIEIPESSHWLIGKL